MKCDHPSHKAWTDATDLVLATNGSPAHGAAVVLLEEARANAKRHIAADHPPGGVEAGAFTLWTDTVVDVTGKCPDCGELYGNRHGDACHWTGIVGSNASEHIVW